MIDLSKYADFEPEQMNEVSENMELNEHDFTVDGFRFIHENSIDKIMQENLVSDESILGCLNAEFLCEILNIDVDVIKNLQEIGAFETLSKLIISMDKLGKLQAQYAAMDGYGHFFNSYDGTEEEYFDYHVFRIE